MPHKQWVNLTRKDVFVEDGITSEHHLDYLVVKTKMKKKDPALLKLRAVVEGGDNIEYSDAEKKRNINFKLVPFSPEVSSGTESTLTQKFYLPAAGGNKYKIEAKYKDKVVATSQTIETIRRLFFQVISMKGVKVPGNLADVSTEFEKHSVELKEKEDGRDKVPLMEVIHNRNQDKFEAAARPAYTAKKYWPFSVACIFSNMSARYANNVNDKHVGIELPAMLDNLEGPPVEVIVDLKKPTGQSAYLWTGLDPEHDKVQFWLVSATFTPDGSTVAQNIRRSDVHLHGVPKYGSGGYSQVRVVLNEVFHGDLFDKVKGSLVLETRIVRGFQGGYSTGSSNMITVCTKSWWKKEMSDAQKVQTFVHELGHKIGLTATGDRDLPTDGSFSFIKPKTPDAPPHLYGEYYEGPKANNKGHQGAHCENGMSAYDAAKNQWTGTPGCAMFGGSPIYDAGSKTYKATPNTFCEDCGKSTRKMDLNGFHIEALKKNF